MALFGRKRTADRIHYHYKDHVERGEFQGAKIVELEMPDSMMIIGENGFRECHSMTRAVLSNHLCEIGAHAFRDCDALENVLMPADMRYPDGTNGMIGIGCFEGCKRLLNITIPNGVTAIGANAFHGCAALESVTLPRSVRAIRSGAFKGCKSLKSLHAASVPELIAIDAFEDTPQEARIAAVRKPVLTIMHRSSYGMLQIFQFSTSARMIGTNQTDGEMSLMLDACDENGVSFRITQYQYAGGRHTVPANTVTRLFYEEYDVPGKAGMQKEEILASYR